MPLGTEIEVAPVQDDFSAGINSRVSVVGLGGVTKTPNFVKDAINAIWRPKRAFGIRSGSRDISQAALTEKPTSLGKFWNSGGNRLFVGTDDGASGGKLFRMSTTGVTQQTITGFTMTNKKLSFEMAGGVLLFTQIGATNEPMFYWTSNPAETWLTTKLPSPPSAPTFNADSAGGSIAAGQTRYYRYRWRYLHGSSKTSAVSAARTQSGGVNFTFNVVLAAPVSPRTDYLGWTLEGTLQDGDSSGPFYVIATGTAGTYADGNADSSLNYESDETIHGEPPKVDGLVFHHERLWGWRGRRLYFSQPVIGAEEQTGICNWVGDANFDMDTDEGDEIQAVVKQGSRLLIGCKRSLHVVEGVDVDSFVKRPIYRGVGFAGPRSFIALGNTVIFYAGSGRAFISKGGDAVEPCWSDELGDQLAQMDPTYDEDVLGVNYKGEGAYFVHRRKDSTTQRDWIGWDLLEGNAVRFRNPPAIDAVVQSGDDDFGGATLLVADPVLRQPSLTTAPSQNPSFYAWRDARSANYEIYTQVLGNADGTPLLAVNGAQVGNSTGSLGDGPAVCADGSGGYIVAYLDKRSGSRQDVYAQRYNASGVAQWAASGVVICNAAGNGAQLRPGICSDGAGGAVIVWGDGRSSTNSRLYAQRIDSAGAVQWTANGVLVHDTAVSVELAVYLQPQVVRGAVGGSLRFVVAWNTFATTLHYDVLDGATGAPLMAPRGTLSGVDSNIPATLVSDGNGGTLLAYSTSAVNMWVRRLTGAGASSWVTNASAGRGGFGGGPALVPTPSGGCYVAWNDSTSGQYHVRCQLLTNAGAVSFTAGGVPISSILATPGTNALIGVADGSGGAIIAWRDGTNGAIRANRIDTSGNTAWGANGARADTTGLTAATGNHRICTDGAGGCILFHADATGSADLYATRLRASDGATLWHVPVVTAAGSQDYMAVAFTDTPEAEYPPGANAGYHVWSVFEGTTDFADINGANGSPIEVEVQSHRLTCGMARRLKTWSRIEVYVNRGNGAFSITVTGDRARLTALSLEATAQAVKYNSGVRYNDGSKYATSGQSTIYRGLPPNVEGRGVFVTFRGEFTDELEIGGWQLEGWALPYAPMSSGG